MTTLESKIGTVNSSDEKIYNLLSDFNNIKGLTPPGKIQGWESTENTCRFMVNNVGEVKMQIVEKEPYKVIKYNGESKIPFYFWVQLKQIDENDTKIKLTIRAELNMMMKMVLSNPLKNALDSLVDQIVLLAGKQN